MAAVLLDGKALAARVQAELKLEVDKLRTQIGRAPRLAVVLVGDNPASQVYVRSKSKNAKSCGIDAVDVHLPKSIANEELQHKLSELSNDPLIDGILLQLPLPAGLDEFAALLCINPAVDVDGLHPISQGMLMRSAPAHRPCTPRGCLRLIDEAQKLLGRSGDLAGLHAVVLGRSILVGKPVALMLLERHCTVSICHSRTRDLKAECRRADILVVAIGKPELVTAEFIKSGAVVIDVGINRLDDGRLVGDVDFASASGIAGALTPVPGGVGPMTIAMLLSNTVESAMRAGSMR